MSNDKKLNELSTLQESQIDKKKKEMIITVVKSGTSKRKNYYSPAVLKESAPRFSDIKMYIDHQDPTKVGKEARSLRDWIGTLKESWYVDDGPNQGRIDARVKIRDEEFWDLVVRASDEGFLNEIGTSMDANAIARLGKDPNGNTAQIVESIHDPHSVDVVTEASAGGSVNEIFESAIAEEEKSMKDIEKMTIDELMELRPDLVKSIHESAIQEIDSETDQEIQRLIDEEDYYLDEETGELWSPDELVELEEELNERGYGIDNDGNLVELEEEEVEEEMEEPVMQEANINSINDVPDSIAKELMRMGYQAATKDSKELEGLEEDQITQKVQESRITRLERDLADAREELVEVRESHVELATHASAVRMLRESGLPTVSKEKLLPYMVGKTDDEMMELVTQECEYLERISPTIINDPAIQESSIESETQNAQARMDHLVGGIDKE